MTASGPITSWQIDGKKMETVTDFIFLSYKITADVIYRHEIKRHLLLGRKAMTDLDSILKSRNITLPTKAHLVKAMFFSSSRVWMWELFHEEMSEFAQSCPTLCNPTDCSLSGSSVHGIFQASVMEWIAISFSRGSSRPRNRTGVSCIAGRFFTSWAIRKALLIE